MNTPFRGGKTMQFYQLHTGIAIVVVCNLLQKINTRGKQIVEGMRLKYSWLRAANCHAQSDDWKTNLKIK